LFETKQNKLAKQVVNTLIGIDKLARAIAITQKPCPRLPNVQRS
jgi:hypothetical protein